jgi:hypothetical protein
MNSSFIFFGYSNSVYSTWINLVGHAGLPDRHSEDRQDPEQRRVEPHQLHPGGGGAQEQVQPLIPRLPGKTKTTLVI